MSAQSDTLGLSKCDDAVMPPEKIVDHMTFDGQAQRAVP
jgi:hypothetical protein